jgi:hypothetical protein
MLRQFESVADLHFLKYVYILFGRDAPASPSDILASALAFSPHAVRLDTTRKGSMQVRESKRPIAVEMM